MFLLKPLRQVSGQCHETGESTRAAEDQVAKVTEPPSKVGTRQQAAGLSERLSSQVLTLIELTVSSDIRWSHGLGHIKTCCNDKIHARNPRPTTKMQMAQ